MSLRVLVVDFLTDLRFGVRIALAMEAKLAFLLLGVMMRLL